MTRADACSRCAGDFGVRRADGAARGIVVGGAIAAITRSDRIGAHRWPEVRPCDRDGL